MNNSIIKLIITLVTFSGISFVVSDPSNNSSSVAGGVIVGPETPVFYAECPLNDCSVLNKSINKFEGTLSYYTYRNPEYNFNDTLFPKILVVLGWDDIINKGEKAILDHVLAQWNEADKYFEQLDGAKIKLAIAGVVISTQSGIWRSTDPSKNSSKRNTGYTASSVLHNMTKWLIDNHDHFRSVDYDFFMLISNYSRGVNYKSNFDCGIKTSSDYHPVGAVVNKIYHALRYAWGIAVMLGLTVDERSGCGTDYLLNYHKFSVNPIWSDCSKRQFKSLFNNSDYSCLHQIPYVQYEDDFTIFCKHF